MPSAAYRATLPAMSDTPADLPLSITTDIAYADRPACQLDVRVPAGITGFSTIVWFHGGGLTTGERHFVPIVDQGIAQVAVDYRLLGRDALRGEDCIEDAAAAVAWTFSHIADYGGDPAKVFVAGMSAGSYLSMMVGMDGSWLAAHGISNRAIAGIGALSGQATKHFAVREYAGDKDPQYVPKIDRLAPLAHVSAEIPPILCVCGEPPWEWPGRSEENRLLIASCTALGHPWARFVQCAYCDHARTYPASLPFLEMFVRGELP